jgi:hypothetical protein
MWTPSVVPLGNCVKLALECVATVGHHEQASEKAFHREDESLHGYGRRWDRPNATAVAVLDTLDRNGQWRQVWSNASYAAT